MRRLIIVGVVIVALVAIMGFTLAGYYNSFVSREQSVDAQWSQVETQYQRRFDLIPNLVAATRGIFAQERAVFGQIADARTRYAGAQTTDERVAAANQVESALARLLVVVENYPQLRSSESVQQLMVQLEGTENRISVERRRYNEMARDYNVAIRRFPGFFYAALFGFETKPYFRSVAPAAEPPAVDLEP